MSEETELTTEEMEKALIDIGVTIKTEKRPDGNFEYTYKGRSLIYTRNEKENRNNAARLFYEQIPDLCRE